MEKPEPGVPVPVLHGLMLVDAFAVAAEAGLRVEVPRHPDHVEQAFSFVRRQYPPPGAGVPGGSPVSVWLDEDERDEGGGDDEGGAGVREPRRPAPPSGGLRRELPEQGAPLPPPELRSDGDAEPVLPA
ncbi:PASTA domain-containing protein [Streptomyces sp. NPDC001941]|uniref:PASTA domain-containing protein n=1 Tax=Streptomyces sp. NPDC001941 TaxID=3154659 RepID=UPI00333064D0